MHNRNKNLAKRWAESSVNHPIDLAAETDRSGYPLQNRWLWSIQVTNSRDGRQPRHGSQNLRNKMVHVLEEHRVAGCGGVAQGRLIFVVLNENRGREIKVCVFGKNGGVVKTKHA